MVNPNKIVGNILKDKYSKQKMVCPNCGSNVITEDNKHFECINCDWKLHTNKFGAIIKKFYGE